MINCQKCGKDFADIDRNTYKPRRFCPFCGEPTYKEKARIEKNEQLLRAISDSREYFSSSLIPSIIAFSKRNQEASIAITIAIFFLGWISIGLIKRNIDRGSNQHFCKQNLPTLRSSYYSSKSTYDSAIRYNASDERIDRLYKEMDKKRDLISSCEKILGLD